MLPVKLGKVESDKDFDNLVKMMLDHFKNGKPLKLKNENELQEGKFTLKKKNQLFNLLDRKLMMGEINGVITDNQIAYKVEMSLLMKIVFWANNIVLIILSISFLSNKEFITGFVLLGFAIIVTVVIYFWLKSEIKYLENRFQEQMKFV